MKYISLFSGIEAASVAWEPLGWEPVAFSEIEPFPCAVLKDRFPMVPNLGDVMEVDWSGYAGSIDLIVGGSPCQAFSVAGKREGLMDSRGQLMLEYVRAVREIRPRWVLWENVPGVLSQDKGEAFATLQDELEQCGYSLAWRVLDAQFFGVAQRRRRVFLVGHSDPGCAAAVLFERESLRWDSPSSRKKRKELAGSVEHVARCGREARHTWSILGNVCDRDARQNGNGVSEDVAPTLNTVDRHAVVYEESNCLNPWDCQSNRVFGVDGPFQTLYAHGGSGRHNCAVLVDTLPFDTTQVTSSINRSNPRFGDPCHTLAAQGDPPTIAFKYHQGAKAGSIGACEDGTTPTLTADYHQPAVCIASIPENAIGRPNSGTNGPMFYQESDPSPTIRASSSVPAVLMASTHTNAEIGEDMGTCLTAHSEKDAPVLNVGTSVRRLMPVECERLQGFHDGWTDLGGTADAPRYRALGNSMAVPVMQWIGRRIALVDSLGGDAA